MPAVAGMFYSASKEGLLKELEWAFMHRLGPGRLPKRGEDGGKPPALIAPHAGYMYSGPVAAHAYLQLEDRKVGTVIVLGPNHYGVGTSVSIFPEGEWITPLGGIEIDRELAMELAKLSDVFSLDEISHEREHSIEVQLPFLQYVLPGFKLVPICILDQSLETCIRIGEALGEILRSYEDVLLVASSDMTHYEPHDQAKEKDSKALKEITALNVEGLYEAIAKYGISMCGYGPVAAILHACRRAGAKNGEVLKYATSGDITGDYGSVVGYASVKIELKG